MSTLLLILFSCGSVCVQEMLDYWRMWAGLWCCTDGPSCPMQPTPANARAPVTRERCNNTPAWLARTVPKGSCCIAPKTYIVTPLHLLLYVNAHLPVMFVSVCQCVSSLSVKVLSAASPCSLTKLHKFSSYSISTLCIYPFIHWPHYQ